LHGDCLEFEPVVGCDGVIYPDYCQMELKGHAVDNPFADLPCAPLPDTCAETGTTVACQAYAFCNKHAVVACRTLDNGFQQVVCGPDL
jgi:hypothetical protein